jgi:hypothetical protein
VVVVESDRTHAVWRGLVTDAHDGTPVAHARIDLILAEPAGTVLARSVAGENGEFELTPSAGAHGALFVVRAPFHADLVSPAPGFGRVRIDLVTRRRHLLGRLAHWASRQAPFRRGRAEPTPAEVARVARRWQRPEVAEWARAVESAAYGPTPVDDRVERAVQEREPPDPRGPGPAA